MRPVQSRRCPEQLREGERAGEPEEQRHPKEHDAGGERAKEQVFQRGLGGPRIVQEADEDVAGQADQLHGDVRHEEVVRLRHQHQAHGDQQQQAEVLSKHAL